MSMFEVHTWHQDPWDANYDCFTVIPVEGETEDEAMTQFREDYPNDIVQFVMAV